MTNLSQIEDKLGYALGCAYSRIESALEYWRLMIMLMTKMFGLRLRGQASLATGCYMYHGGSVDCLYTYSLIVSSVQH